MNYELRDILSSGNRDKTEIMAAIVVITQKRKKITHIQNLSKLGFSTLKKYLKLMIRLSLIERKKIVEDSKKRVTTYQATQKGLNYLKVYCELLNLIYGNNFLEIKHNLAVACLKYCRMNEAK